MNDTHKTILGIDPGFHIAGYGVVRKESCSVKLIDYGYLSMSPKKSLPERTGIFHEFFAQKIQHYAVTDLALETPFLGRNAQNFLKLGYLRGILYFLVDRFSLNLHEFSPRQVKQAVTGFGGASKEQVSRAIQQLCLHAVTASKYDVTDALAVTLCALWSNQSLSERYA